MFPGWVGAVKQVGAEPNEVATLNPHRVQQISNLGNGDKVSANSEWGPPKLQADCAPHRVITGAIAVFEGSRDL